MIQTESKPTALIPGDLEAPKIKINSCYFPVFLKDFSWHLFNCSIGLDLSTPKSGTIPD